MDPNTSVDAESALEVPVECTGSPDTILQWLLNLDLEDGPSEVDISRTKHEQESEQGEATQREPPKRPDRKHEVQSELEDVSPTTTHFSSIFEPSERYITSRPTRETPITGAQDRARSFSDDSTTNVGDEDEYCRELLNNLSEGSHLAVVPHRPFGQIGVKDSASSGSYDQPNSAHTLKNKWDYLDLLQEKPPNISKILPRDPPVSFSETYIQGPHLVFITSCFQCLLAGLPCSRTLPACSRCKRFSYSDLCLLHRRKLLEECIPGDTVGNHTPVLIKTKGDDEELWERKTALLGELHQAWVEQEHKKNWVLPDMCGLRGNYWNDRRKVGPVHPGEGKGRLTCRELYLALS